MSHLRKPEISKPLILHQDFEQTAPTFSPKWDIVFIILAGKQISPPAWREIVSLASKATHYADILKNMSKLLHT